jgi:hypothetical protein
MWKLYCHPFCSKLYWYCLVGFGINSDFTAVEKKHFMKQCSLNSKKWLLVCLLFVGITSNTLAQNRTCGTAEYKRKLLEENPGLQSAFNNIEGQIDRYVHASNTRTRDTFANELITIPVVIHLLYNTASQNISDDQVQSQIIALNNDFSNQNFDKANRPEVFKNLASDIRIKFCIAQVDPQGKRTNGIIRKFTPINSFSADDAMKFSAQGGDDAWPYKKYLNIWVCPMGIRGLGYTAPLGSPAELDGVVVAYDVFGTIGTLRPPFNKGRTATHEVGHWLGLKHLWGDEDCGDDGVEDTPKQKSYNYGCPTFPRVTLCSPNTNGDMYMNYMDYSNDACMNMFTIGQKKRMRALFATGNFRNTLLVSFACDSTLAQGGPLPVDTLVVVPADVFNVYPNPVHSSVTIEYKPGGAYQQKNVTVYSILGKKMLVSSISHQKKNLDFSALSAGVYILKIGENFTTKLIRL